MSQYIAPNRICLSTPLFHELSAAAASSTRKYWINICGPKSNTGLHTSVISNWYPRKSTNSLAFCFYRSNYVPDRTHLHIFPKHLRIAQQLQISHLHSNWGTTKTIPRPTSFSAPCQPLLRSHVPMAMCLPGLFWAQQWWSIPPVHSGSVHNISYL